MDDQASNSDTQSNVSSPDLEPAQHFEVSESREATVGSIGVRRALPHRARRTVGAWCFADHMGPADVSEESGLDIGPHPHMGLQTVTWLIEGEALHRDSLGTEQVIASGQLNLMTAGSGVSHSEESTGHYRGTLQGVQLWIAQPEATRHHGADFAHLAEPPRGDLDGAGFTVLIGEFENVGSPVRHDSALLGLDLEVRESLSLPLRPDFEYALVVLDGALSIDGQQLSIGKLGYLRPGRDEVSIDVTGPTRTILLGGEPFEEPILMWWNFVGRTRAEIDEAYESWHLGDSRFGTFKSSLPRIPVEAPAWRQREKR